MHKPMTFFDHDYDQLLKDIKFLTLSYRRVMLDLIFISKLLISRIDSPDLLECIRLHVPEKLSKINYFLLIRTEHPMGNLSL